MALGMTHLALQVTSRAHPYSALRRCVVVLITNFAELTSPRFIRYSRYASVTAASS